MGIRGAQVNGSGEQGLNYTAGGPNQALFSVVFWLRSDPTIGSFDTPFVLGSSTVEAVVFTTRTNTNALPFALYPGPTTGRAVIRSQWYFVSIIVASLSDFRLYVDGVLDIVQAAGVGNATGGISLYHDWVTGSTDQMFPGQLEHVRVWNNVALSPVEILQEMNSLDGSPVVHRDKLWAWWSLSDLNSGILDQSGNGRNLTQVGTLLTGAPGVGLGRPNNRRRYSVGKAPGAAETVSLDKWYQPNPERGRVPVLVPVSY